MSNSDPTFFERLGKGGTGQTGPAVGRTRRARSNDLWSRFSCYWPPAIRPPSLKPYEARCEPGNAPHGSSTTQEAFAFGEQLDRLLDSVEDGLLGPDPALALGLLEEFLQSDRWILERVDEFGPAASARPTGALVNCSPTPRRGWLPPAALAERIALLVEKDDYVGAPKPAGARPKFFRPVKRLPGWWIDGESKRLKGWVRAVTACPTEDPKPWRPVPVIRNCMRRRPWKAGPSGPARDWLTGRQAVRARWPAS